MIIGKHVSVLPEIKFKCNMIALLKWLTIILWQIEPK